MNKKDPITITHPHLVKEWDWKKNDLSPENYTFGSDKKVWWLCKKNHLWRTSIEKRTKAKTGCPYCSNKKVLIGFNDLTTTNPYLAKEWNYNKNVVEIENVCSGSHKKVWWKCSLDHEWQTTIADRVTKNVGCPYCSNKKLLSGYNDLKTMNPKIAEEWNYDKNILSPCEIIYGSNKKVWWKCALGHEWKTTVSERRRNKNCPYCSGKKILVGFNDLATTHPHLLQEWDYEKNTTFPTKISRGSNHKVWWICENNHSWEAMPRDRIKGKSCQRCNQSSGEKELAKFIDSITSYKILCNDRTLISPYELDIVIPELKIAFEYNGEYWHSENIIQQKHNMSADDYHQMKTDKCDQQGIKLFFVWEKDWRNNENIVKTRIEKIILDKQDPMW